ncbi:MAG: BolA family protein [Gammaproteobacteria bacterium]|nr:BolA family protein [Gammaproteobacteria bacterium]
MTNDERIQMIQQRLQNKFAPDMLEIRDDGAKHAGHASNHGAGYYTVTISAVALKNLSRPAQHRAIYAELNDLIPDEIHALSIVVK